MLVHAKATAVAEVRAAVVWADTPQPVVSRPGVNAASGMARATQHVAPADVCCSVSSVALAAAAVCLQTPCGFRPREASAKFSPPYIILNVFVIFSPGVKCVHHHVFL